MDGSSKNPGQEALPTDTLVEQAAAGDEVAVEVLCGRLRARLSVWARGRLPPPARDLFDTDDLVQEAMIRSLRRLPTFENCGTGSFLQYLKTAVLNGIRNEIRRAKRRGTHVELDHEIHEPAPTAIEQLMGRQAEQHYREALSQLTAEDQDLVIARIELQMSASEIAIHSGRPTADAARMATHRAILKLAKALRIAGP